jgi:hypothetical protein
MYDITVYFDMHVSSTNSNSLCNPHNNFFSPFSTVDHREKITLNVIMSHSPSAQYRTHYSQRRDRVLH